MNCNLHKNIVSFTSKSLATVAFLLAAMPAFAADPAATARPTETGEAIYKRLCLECHGEAGKGSKKFKKALTGDLSVGQLTKLIDETMPEENPDLCVGEEARKVAEFIHESFYSPTAQARNKPPRVEMVRLTVGQYQNALMDLVGSFRSAGQTPEMKGLKGEYYSSRQMRRETRVIERVDPVIAFDWGPLRPNDPVEEKKPNAGAGKAGAEAKGPDAAKPPADPAKARPQSFGPVEVALVDQLKK
ncbi:MAG: c-type cytochrome, partial [bacterium]